MDAEKQGITFSEGLKRNKEIAKYLSIDEIEYTLDPQNYVGHSEEIVERVLKTL